MFKFSYIFLFLILLIFTACSERIVGASPSQIKDSAVVMVAKTDIICDSYHAKKGTVFNIKEMSAQEYKIRSNAGSFGDVFNLISGGNTYQFGDNVLLLKWDDSMENTLNPGKGFVVFPNGKFAYDDYFIAVYNSSFGGRWWLAEFQCEYNGEFPFEIRENR